MSKASITKQAIGAAMKDLMSTMALSKISVGHIVKVCGINRNSFYYHFKDKYDLVNWIFYTEIISDINKKGAYKQDPLFLIESVIVYLCENKAFYQNALASIGQNSFSEYFLMLIKSFILPYLESLYQDQDKIDFFADFYSRGFLASIENWLDQGCEMDPSTMANLLCQTLGGKAS